MFTNQQMFLFDWDCCISSAFVGLLNSQILCCLHFLTEYYVMNWGKYISWTLKVQCLYILQAEAMVAEWREFLWDIPEERIALWKHCHELFLKHSLPSLQVLYVCLYACTEMHVVWVETLRGHMIVHNMTVLSLSHDCLKILVKQSRQNTKYWNYKFSSLACDTLHSG